MIQHKFLIDCLKLSFLAVIIMFAAGFVSAQTPSDNKSKSAVKLPKVTKIDEAGLKAAIKPNGKPVLVNFWATWCDPCREEFPDLVAIDAEYKGKIDFVTISLDDPAEITRDVPQFLSEMKAEMPAYLLRVPDEGVVIAMIAKNWQGGLPFTVLYDQDGSTAYIKQGKFKPDVMRAEIDKLIGKKQVPANEVLLLELPRSKPRGAEDGRADALADIAKGKLILKRYGLTPAIDPVALRNVKARWGVEVQETGCVLFGVTPQYFAAYNEVVRAELRRRFGNDIDSNLRFI